MTLKLRARRPEDKQERHEAILKAARALFVRSSHLETTIAEVAQRAGVAKGTVFLYFATREALELAVLREEMTDFFQDFDAALDEPGRWTNARVTQVVSQAVSARPLLVRLLCRLETTLEHNVSDELREDFRKFLLEHVMSTGLRLERRLPSLDRNGGGIRLMIHVRALMAGLWMMAEAGPVISKALEKPGMSALRVDFDREFEFCVATLLKGMDS